MSFLSGKKALSRQIRVCRHKYMMGHDKTRLLSRQKYACCDKRFVATNMCLSRQVLTSIQAYKIMFLCRDKTFVATKIFSRDKDVFVATKVLTFVATKMILAAAPANHINQL